MVLAEDLRQAVLQAALQGKLTEQLETDSDVDEMLVSIQEEKKLLLDKKNAREEKAIPIEEDEEKPYDVPQNWRWEKLGNIGVYKKGPFGSALTKSIFVPKGANTVKVYEQKNAIQKDASLGEYYITKEYFESKMKGFAVESGDIIVSCAGTIGETYIMPDNLEFGIINQALMRMNIVKSINISYFLIYFDNVLKMEAQKGSKGSAIKNIPPFEVFKRMLIPIPPIEEQQRIVDKINEIMPKIDEYEKIEKELEALKKEFPINMKDALLQAAMQGKLTEQLESDSSVDELLEVIRKQKEKLIAQKKIKKEKPLSDITEEEIPFDIPDNWRWVRWGNLAYSIQYGYNAPAQESGKIKMVRISDIQDNSVNWDSVPYCDISDEEMETYLLKENDILFARTGGTVGKSFLVSNVPEDAIYAGYLIRTRYNNQLIPQYLKLFMESQLYWVQLQNGKTQGCQPNCNGQTLSKMMIPLPPIEEQQRIVERLDVLLPLCEDLKEE